MSIDVREIFMFLAYTIPGIMLFSGILLSVIGYPFNQLEMIKAGGALILLGVGTYILEFFIFLVRYYSSDYE